mmetsp:Transcript_46780/g.84480  ORF Transcript_46780/g.84480 Transcript_46780/m.84480 type:complete len:223 (+) Transcript_46780:1269-1937(+)
MTSFGAGGLLKMNSWLSGETCPCTRAVSAERRDLKVTKPQLLYRDLFRCFCKNVLSVLKSWLAFCLSSVSKSFVFWCSSQGKSTVWFPGKLESILRAQPALPTSSLLSSSTACTILSRSCSAADRKSCKRVSKASFSLEVMASSVFASSFFTSCTGTRSFCSFLVFFTMKALATLSGYRRLITFMKAASVQKWSGMLETRRVVERGGCIAKSHAARSSRKRC